MKKCTKCSVEKLLNDFNKDKSKGDGFSCWCKECINQKSKDWYLQNKEKHRIGVNEYKKKWNKDNDEHITTNTVLTFDNMFINRWQLHQIWITKPCNDGRTTRD